MRNEPKYKIGQQYQTRGKYPRLCTITDILKTYNSKDELVKITYVSTHEFLGQIVTNYDVVQTTITLGIAA
jgi:hypothetical protein